MLNATHQYQNDLAKFCRTGIYTPIPGVKEKNIGRYRNLIYNIVDDSLQSAYPLTHNLLEKEEWDNMVNTFFSSHRCQSPLVWKMPKELLEYMQESNHQLLHKYEFLSDLLQLEWYEVEIYMMEDKEVPTFTKEGIMSQDAMVLNPELSILSLAYPVHLKNASTIEEADKGQYFVCLHRESETSKVLFTDIKYPHIELIEKLSNEMTGFDDLLEIFQKYGTKEEATNALSQFLKSALKSNLILGFSN